MPDTAPNSEQARQRKLDSYRLLDTLPESTYDDIVRVASLLCGTPVALMTLVDRERQWFKAKVGIDALQTPRDVAFCEHAIRSPETPLVVDDAARDPRFAQNPLVTGEPGIRFYAGVPLQAPSGEALGTVCVIDRVPRTLDDAQLAGLQALARLAVALMEVHRERLAGARADSDRAFQAAAHAQSPEPPQETAGAVAIVQLDDVARVREAGGAQAVARLLALIEPAIRAGLSPGDIIGPHGDHELLLVLGSADDAAARLQGIHQAVSARLADAACTITIGAAVASGEKAQPMEALFLRADDALSDARGAGGDRVVVLGA